MVDANSSASPLVDGNVETEDQQENAESTEDGTSFEFDSDMSDDEVSLLEVDDSELSSAMQEAGISIKVPKFCIVSPSVSAALRYARLSRKGSIGIR